jgi:hypothetical protein
MCVRSKHIISSRRFFFPESCVRKFAETSGKDTFSAWASGLNPCTYKSITRNNIFYLLSATEKIYCVLYCGLHPCTYTSVSRNNMFCLLKKDPEVHWPSVYTTVNAILGSIKYGWLLEAQGAVYSIATST